MKKTVLSVLTAGMLTFSASAYAQEVKTNINFETRDITISGSFEEAAFNRMLSVEVVEKDDQTAAHFIGTVPTDKEGNFNYTFRLPEEAETGYYYINLGVYGMDKSVNEIYFAKKADIDALLNVINNASSAQEIKTEIEKNVDVLNISKVWYEKLDEKGKTAISEALYNGRGSDGFASLADATAAAEKELSVQAFRCASTAAEIKEAMNSFADIYNINAETTICYNLFNSFEAKNQEKALGLMADREEVSDVITVYNEDTLLTAVNEAADPASVREYLDDEEYRKVISFSLSEYDSSDKDKTAKYIYNCDDFKTMSDLEKAIKDAQNDKDNDNDPPKRPSTGGGGSSSGGGSGITNYPPSIIENNNNDKDDDNKPGTDTETDEAFSDIKDAEWAREAILYLSEKSVISGTGDGRFEPNLPVTREQFAVMIVKAFGLSDESAECSFLDLSSDHWAYNSVAAAYKNGIISGISETEFGTGREITRQDMAVMSYRAAKAAGHEFASGNSAEFTDIDLISDYALESVSIMNANGIINGYPDGSFAPDATATRAQAAQVIYTLIK